MHRTLFCFSLRVLLYSPHIWCGAIETSSSYLSLAPWVWWVLRVDWRWIPPHSNSSRGQKQGATRCDEAEGPLQGTAGQAWVGTAVAHSHYCSSTGLEEKLRSRHMATLPRPPLRPPATHTQEGLVAPGGTTRTLHSSHVWQGSGAKQSVVALAGMEAGWGVGWVAGCRG